MLMEIKFQSVRGRRPFRKDKDVGFVKTLSNAILGGASDELTASGAQFDVASPSERGGTYVLNDLDDGQALQQQLEALFDEPAALLAGSVQLIGLEKVR